MSENLQKLLKESLLNNSYDYDAMHNTLKKTWMNSFSYLYTLQKAYVEYEELFYFSNDTESRNSKRIGHLYLDGSNYAHFNIDYDLINVFAREEFRTSEFYFNEFTIKDMIYNPTIFLKIPVVIIDDQVIWDYKIKITKDCTNFKLPFKRNFVLEDKRKPDDDDIIYIDHKVQVLVIDNIFYQRIEINKNNLFIDRKAKTMKISKNTITSLNLQVVEQDTTEYFMKKWKLPSITHMTESQKQTRLKEYNRRVKVTQLPNKDGVMMCSLHFINGAGRGYELGTQLIPLKDNGDSYIADLSDDLLSKLDAHKYEIYFTIWHVNRLYHHRFHTGLEKTIATEDGADLMVIQDKEMLPYNMPIPVEDFMVFKKSSSDSNKGFILEKNTEMLEMHYPNIYRIKDESLQENDEYDIYYFYYKTDDLKYTVLFDFYFTYLIDTFEGQSLERIINDIYYNKSNLSDYTDEQKEKFKEVFNKIMQYQYYNHQYAESDFLHRYLPTPGNTDKEPVEYKDETLKDWVKVEPWVLRDYVLEQNKLGASFHLFTNTIDLNSRLRYDTEPEFGEFKLIFKEPRYVFAFNNEREFQMLLNCRVFVDGIMVVDVYQERHLFMDYFYIPVDLVTEDSYIELEIFPEYEFRQELTFTSIDDEKEITLAEPSDVIYPTMQDIYLENTERTERFKKDLFDFNIHYSKGDFNFESDDPDKPVKFTRLSTFKIKPKTEDLLNTPLNFTITKNAKVIRFMAERAGYAYIELREKGFSFNTDYLRVFRNGRLMPRSKYRLVSTYNSPKLLFLDWFNAGDIIFIDITPYRYTEIYYQEELTQGDTLIDLRSIINKPFDIRYYDVYINGRKLSLNNVFSITPWQITLVNLKSNYNLVIYEKERDWEYFGLDYNENIYYYSLDDLFKDGIVKEDVKNQMIKDIIDSKKDPRLNIYPNTNDEEKMDMNGDDLFYVIFDIFYSDELLPKTYMNPDILQEIEEGMKDAFIEVYDKYMISSLDDAMTDSERARREHHPKVLCLDPDIHYGTTDNPDEYRVYSVGHPDDEIEQEYLEQHIEIPEIGNIDKL